MVKFRFIKEAVLVTVACCILLIGPMQGIIVPPSLSSLSWDDNADGSPDLKSCFDSFANAFNWQLKCTKQTMDSDKKNGTSINIFLDCLETSLKAMNHPSCSSDLFQNKMDPPTLLSLYVNTTVIFPQEDSELCRNIQDDLVDIGLVKMHAIIPEGARRESFFGCKLFEYNVMMCCT